MTLLIFYALLALGVSFLCSILEAVLLSVRPAFIGALQEEGNRTGVLLGKLKEDVDRPLAAILSLNTIANTVGAVGVGAQAQVVFGDSLVAVTSAVLTLGILFFSEIIPKTLGATHWRRLAPFVARTLPILIVLTFPLVWLAKQLMTLLSPEDAPPTLSRAEMTAMTTIGEREGIFEKGESRVLQNVLRFGDLAVKDIMTPRIVALTADEDMTVEAFFDKYPNPIFSRIPVYHEDQDDITGYVLKTDLLLELARDRHHSRLVEHRRELRVVPQSQSVRGLFDLLISNQEHIALVVDEYGGMAGIATMEDVVETLLGLEIVDESDISMDMRAVARQQWARRAKRMGFVPEDFENGEGPPW